MFLCPIIRVVLDLARSVNRDVVPLKNPLKSGFAVNDVLVGPGRNSFDANIAIVDDGVLLFFGRELHLLHPEIIIPCGCVLVSKNRYSIVWLDCLVIQMQVRQLLAGFIEGQEILKRIYKRDSW